MAARPKLTLSSDLFSYWIMDRKAGHVRIIFRDGTEIQETLDPVEPALSSEVLVSVFDWDRWWVENLTSRGNFVAAEVYSPTTADPTYGRKTVYLDQNHWSTVAAALTHPDRVRDKQELSAALELAHLAGDGGIIVPLSSAHLRETSALFGDRRYEVGIAMASLSAGWQLRHPNRVWRDEITRSIAVELGIEVPASATRSVVTLEPHALLDDGTDVSALDPHGTELFLLAMGAPSVHLELLIDPTQALPSSIPGWVDRQVDLTGQIASSGLGREQKRAAAYSVLWADNAQPVGDALAAIGAAPSALGHLTGADVPRLLGREPMLSYFSTLMTQRLINSRTRWRENDLTDLMFLATGAGYADYVVAENHTGTQLQQAQRSSGMSSTVFTRLGEAVAAIRGDGVTTVGERAGTASPAE